GIPTSGRMLLSHNFDVSPNDFPPLSREAFTEVFRAGLNAYELIQCQQVNHPHWIVEIRFPADALSPSQVGELCAKALGDKRRSPPPNNAIPHILILGGLKSTPPTSNSPDTLQPGDWGVDVVETPDGEAFLQKIAWDTTVSQRPADTVFKVELKDD
ncbi:MAG: DUF2656 domain-containing protein, partial [Cyanobacteria bacterium J06626_18]